MKIISRIKDSQIHSAEYKEGSTFCSYNFINCDIYGSISVNGEEYPFTMQTGHFYDGNDYSRPSNTLSVYDDGSHPLLWKLENISDSELESIETVSEINEFADTNFTQDELVLIKDALSEIDAEAQMIVDEAEREADEEREKDKTIYVVQHYIDEDGEHYSYPSIELFNDEDDANDYIENNPNSYINFDEGRKLYEEYQAHKRREAC